uniref:MAP kinase-activating death domain-containing protein n=1 Tax=Anopheles culicifacies TaxID=139723 RepID=A0A182M9U6_9DIPT
MLFPFSSFDDLPEPCPVPQCNAINSEQFFIRLNHIRKCFTQKGGVFILEEYNPKSRLIIQRKYKSAMADQICYAVLCVFSYIAAGQEQTKQQHGMQGSASGKGTSSGAQHVPVPAGQSGVGLSPSAKGAQSLSQQQQQQQLQHQSQKIQQVHLPQQSSPKLKTVVGKPISPKQSAPTIQQPVQQQQSQQPPAHPPPTFQPQPQQQVQRKLSNTSQPDVTGDKDKTQSSSGTVKPPTIPARPKVTSSSSSISSSPPMTKAPILVPNRGPPPAIPPRTSLSQRSDSVSSASSHQQPLQRQYSAIEPSASGRATGSKPFPFRSLQKQSTDASGNASLEH